jgi:hypothetical protein
MSGALLGRGAEAVAIAEHLHGDTQKLSELFRESGEPILRERHSILLRVPRPLRLPSLLRDLPVSFA